MNEHIKHVTDATFDNDVLKAGTPVLVDYWAEWCGPCKMIAPILDDVAKSGLISSPCHLRAYSRLPRLLLPLL